MDYWGGAKGYVGPPLKLLRGPAPAPPPPRPPFSYAYALFVQLFIAKDSLAAICWERDDPLAFKFPCFASCDVVFCSCETRVCRFLITWFPSVVLSALLFYPSAESKVLTYMLWFILNLNFSTKFHI